MDPVGWRFRWPSGGGFGEREDGEWAEGAGGTDGES